MKGNKWTSIFFTIVGVQSIPSFQMKLFKLEFDGIVHRVFPLVLFLSLEIFKRSVWEGKYDERWPLQNIFLEERRKRRREGGMKRRKEGGREGGKELKVGKLFETAIIEKCDGQNN